MKLQIKNSYFMKNSTPPQRKPIVLSLFQVAAQLEDSVRAASLKKTAPASSRTPFVDLMMNPDKLEAALKAASAENGAFDASRTITRSDGNHPQQRPSSAGVAKQGKSIPPRPTRKVKILLEAPAAKSVKLAGDFTDWEKRPLDMLRSQDGVWLSVIPLEPGQYSYRFIVDGQWCDDPRSTRRVPNPFGTENALLVVT